MTIKMQDTNIILRITAALLSKRQHCVENRGSVSTGSVAGPEHVVMDHLSLSEGEGEGEGHPIVLVA